MHVNKKIWRKSEQTYHGIAVAQFIWYLTISCLQCSALLLSYS